MSITNILKGIGGEFEIGRVLLTTGAGAAVVTPVAFQIWAMWHGAAFDVTAWCTAYPGGLAALITSGALGIGGKDRMVATAKQTTGDTTSTTTTSISTTGSSQ